MSLLDWTSFSRLYDGSSSERVLMVLSLIGLSGLGRNLIILYSRGVGDRDLTARVIC